MRCFVGLALDEATRGACVEAQRHLARAAFDCRHTAPENLHLTLAFLGEVARERVEEIASVIDAVACESVTFDLTLDRLGAFPNERRPRIVYLGSRDAGAHFRDLVYALRGAYRTLGFTFEDDAVAHITLARVHGESERPLPMLDLNPQPMPVTEIRLFESLRRNGSLRYDTRYRAAFRA